MKPGSWQGMRLGSFFAWTIPNFPAGPPSPAEKRALAAILVAAFALRVTVAILFPNVHHPDEVFQYLEQGHRLAFGYGIVPWEYRDGTRSWSFPGFLGGLMWLTARLGGGASAYLAVIATVLAAFSTAIVGLAWHWARALAGPAAALIAAAIAAGWFELVYFAGKSLTEVPAAVTLFAAAYLLMSGRRTTRRALLAGGFLLGLTFVLRLHLAPAILLVALFGCLDAPMRKGLLVGIGGLVVVAAAGMLDWATWGLPFQSLWKNFYVNVVDGKASQFGTTPWYGYILQYVWAWSGFIVPMACFTLYGARRVPAIFLIPLVIVVSHSLVGHKEYRFLYPALPFILLLAAVGTADFADAMKRAWPRLGKGALAAALSLAWILSSASLAVGDRSRGQLRKSAPRLAAFVDLRGEGALCGLGLVGLDWAFTGGYAYLHRNVPFYSTDPRNGTPASSNAFNFALAPVGTTLPDQRFSQMRCYSKKVCLYRRPGACGGEPERSVNPMLRRVGR